MSSRARMAIAAVVVMSAAGLLGTALVADDPGRVRLVFDVGGWIAALFGAFGTVAAARTFARGDYLRRVWVLLATGAVLLVAGHAIRSAWLHAGTGADFYDSSLVYPRLAVVAAANAATTWGLVLLAYSYTHSGLSIPRTAAFNATWLAASAVAMALLVGQLREDLTRFGTALQAASSLTSIASTLGDSAQIVLIPPILRVAYLMRGGRLAGAWWAIGLSGALWLIYDCKTWIAMPLPFDDAHVLSVVAAVRIPALALTGLAGLLHREAITAEA